MRDTLGGGARILEGRAVTGHKTDRAFARYAESANKRVLASKAMANLHEKFAKSAGKNAENRRKPAKNEEAGGGQG